MNFCESFKKTIFISAIGHLAVFSLFSLSFSNKIPNADYTIFFWGQFLRNSQVSQPVLNKAELFKNLFMRKPDTLTLDKLPKDSDFSLSRFYAKPALPIYYKTEKAVFIEQPLSPLQFPKRPQPQIIFHPVLPYEFSLYFRDRQIAHVELMFKTVPTPVRNSILIKRKISSGNLELDLLTLRYIGHYLFIQPMRPVSDNWQTVKIDLSAKND
jgi:hypothetical protein